MKLIGVVDSVISEDPELSREELNMSVWDVMTVKFMIAVRRYRVNPLI